MWSNMTWWLAHHLSDEQECEGVGEIGGPERDKAMQQVLSSVGGLISRTSSVMLMAKTASLNATNRMVSRRTEGESGPGLAPGASAIASQRTQRLTGETSAAPRRATRVGHRIAQGLSASVQPRPRGRTGGCQSQIEHHVVVRT
jgi:hypothetical protein